MHKVSPGGIEGLVNCEIPNQDAKSHALLGYRKSSRTAQGSRATRRHIWIYCLFPCNSSMKLVEVDSLSISLIYSPLRAIPAYVPPRVACLVAACVCPRKVVRG